MRALTGLLVALHILSSVAGFGAVVATGVLARAAGGDPPSPAALRYFRPGPNWPSYLVLLVPVFGAGLEASSGWADVHLAWPWVALGIWAVAAAAGAGVHWPAERRIQSLLAARGPAGPASGDLGRACRGATWSAGLMTACFAAALVVMVTQPR